LAFSALPGVGIMLVVHLVVGALLSHTHNAKRVWINVSTAIVLAFGFLQQLFGGLLANRKLPAAANVDFFGTSDSWEGGLPTCVLLASLLYVPALFRHRAVFLPPALAAGLAFVNPVGSYIAYPLVLLALLLIAAKYEYQPYNRDDPVRSPARPTAGCGAWSAPPPASCSSQASSSPAGGHRWSLASPGWCPPRCRSSW
jgi:hypothetical protein